jgi:hypothetical protein
MKLLAVMLGLYIIAVVLGVLVSCAHIFPTGCQRGDQIQDQQHRVMQNDDCYVCDIGAPGTFNAAAQLALVAGVVEASIVDAGMYRDAP